MRPHSAFLLKAIIVVVICGAVTVLAGLYKESREEVASLQARLDSVLAATPVNSLSDPIPEAVLAGDPYLSASEVLSLEELPTQEGVVQFRYLVVEVPGEKGASRRVSFKMRTSLVADFLKRSIACEIFR